MLLKRAAPLTALAAFAFLAVTGLLQILPSARALPPAGNDTLDVTAEIDVTSRIGSETIPLAGSVEIQRGNPYLDNGMEVVDTEIVSLNLTGMSSVGAISVVDSGTLVSSGQIRSLQPPPDQFPASSFFDVFTVATVPGSPGAALQLRNTLPFHVENDTDIMAWPPAGMVFSGDQSGSIATGNCTPPGGGGIALIPELPGCVYVTRVSITIVGEQPTATPCASCTATPTGTITPSPTATVTPPGGKAIIALDGCIASRLQGTGHGTDDGSTGAVTLPFTADFFGTSYNGVYVNNNGNVSFNGALGSFAPDPLSTIPRDLIAPFMADVDTRDAGSGVVSYGTDTYQGHAALCVNWYDVGYYNSHSDKKNQVQLLLVDRSDVSSGDFDAIMNYDKVAWEAGDLNNAVGGICGIDCAAPRAGYASGPDFFEIAGAGIASCYLDSTSDGLIHHSMNSGQNGRYIFEFRGGSGPTQGSVPAVCLGGGVPTPTFTPTVTPVPLAGDADCSKLVTSVDSLYVLQFDVGLLGALPCPGNGDVNGQDGANSIDALLILQYVAGLLTTWPP